MRRTTPLAVASLLGAALLTTPVAMTPATAVGEACRGEAATIVGTSTEREPVLIGTDGRDVIVSGTAATINGLGGDDLVCITGPALTLGTVKVDAGTGNDTVDTTGAPAVQVDVMLGAGGDTFVGGPAHDDVQTSGYDSAASTAVPDTDRDVVATGAGHDTVYSFHTGGPNPDEISTGEGNDSLTATGPLADDGRLDGGDGTDRLSLTVRTGNLALDAASATARLDGAEWTRWSSVEALHVSAGDTHVVYRGTPGADGLRVNALGGSPTVDASTGAGRDAVTLAGYWPFGRTELDLGRERDSLEALSRTSFEADLRSGTLSWGGEDHPLRGAEDVSAYAEVVRLEGDGSRNLLQGGGCDVRVSGGGGADVVERRAGESDGLQVQCGRGRMVLEGGRGNDRLDGSYTRDVLRGGPGRDVLIGRQGDDLLDGGRGRDRALGGPDRDRCRAERTRSCER